MTIDEAIENLKYDTEMDMHVNGIAPQLAEWLEELKAYREIGTVEECKNSVLDIQKAYNKAIDDFANWLVEQGILGNRCISDGEITDYGKVYAKKYKEQLKEA